MNTRSRLFYAYVVLAIAYAATFLLPRQISTMPQLSSDGYRLLSLTILVPLLIIWFVAFYGYAKLREYSRLIAGTPDGKQVAKLATGTMIIAFGLPITSICGGVLGIITQHQPDFAVTASILRNYISPIPPLVGFIFISHGAYGLAQLAKHRPRLRSTHGMAIVFVTIAVLHSYVTLSSNNLQAIYHLPVWLILTTIVIPYLYTWYIGLQSAYEIHLYSRNAPGKLYRRTWNLLASGLALLVIMQVVVQYVATVTVQFTSLRLVRLFVIIYVLLAGLSIGYLLVAIGAKRLQKIEEV